MPPAAEANVEKCFAFAHRQTLTLAHMHATHSHSLTHTQTAKGQLGRTWTSSDSLPLAKPNYTYRQTDSTTRAFRGVREELRQRGGRGKGLKTFILLSLSLSFAVGVRVRTYACEPFVLTLRPHNSSINFHVLGPQLPLLRTSSAPLPALPRPLPLPESPPFGDCNCVVLCAWTEEGVLLPKCCPLPSFPRAKNSSTVVRNWVRSQEITDGS